MKKSVRYTGLLLAFLLWLPLNAQAKTLIPGGELMGLSLQDGSVTVAALDESLSAGKAAGLKPGDRITHIDGAAVASASELRDALCRSDGQVQIRLLRAGKEKQLTAQPDITKNGPRLGIYLKEGVTGVGTVTWYDPDTNAFGALGHSVNGPDGSLLNMQQGQAYSAKLVSVKKGKSGDPGQLLGSLDPDMPLGKLEKNTASGIFGTLNKLPEGTPMETAHKDAVHTGAATIRATVSDGPVQEYSVKILKIYPSSRSDGRNMLIKVTDKNLLATTGGIVQGMSGSPIIQDGKLIGAVTHVLVNDPTTGYGIFIENMLDAAA